MSGYIGSKASVTLVDGYTQAEADAEFVQDPNGAITVSGSNVGIGTSSPTMPLSVSGTGGAGGQTGAYMVADFYDTSAGAIDVGGGIGFRGNDGVNSNVGFGIIGGFKENSTSGNYASYLSFKSRANAGSLTERMRIDSSGNVGIGTSSPSNTLSLEGSGTGLNINSTNDEVKKIAFENSGVLTGYIGSSTSSPLRFLNGSGTERMRINSSGNLLIKTTGPAIPVSALAAGSVEAVGASANNVFKAKVTTSAYIAYASQGPTSGAAPFYYHSYMLNGSNTAAGHITVNNTSTSYSTSSDYRLKTDAQPMTGASARVQALNPVNFEWIADGTRVDGFLAHEAQEVVPECATGTKDAMRDEEYEVTAAVEATYDDDGNELTPAVDAVMGTRSVPDYQGIDQSKLVPLLTAALQEALTEITDLKARVIALEGN